MFNSELFFNKGRSNKAALQKCIYSGYKRSYSELVAGKIVVLCAVDLNDLFKILDITVNDILPMFKTFKHFTLSLLLLVIHVLHLKYTMTVHSRQVDKGNVFFFLYTHNKIILLTVSGSRLFIRT